MGAQRGLVDLLGLSGGYNECDCVLAEHRVSNSNDRRLTNRLMFFKNSLAFRRVELESTAVDSVFITADDMDKTILVDENSVTGEEPVTTEALCCLLRVLLGSRRSSS